MAEPINPQDSPTPPQRKRPGRGIGALFAGATYPLRAIATLQRYPQLRQYVIYPILINIVLFITLYTSAVYGGLRAIDVIIQSVPDWTAQTPPWATQLPEWHFTWPTWVSRLPHVSLPSLSLPTIPLPQLSWPQWSISAPDWLSPMLAWRPALPNWVAELPEWGAIILLWLLRLVLTLILFVITGFIFLQFGVLLGSPWYGKLSEELEQIRTGRVLIVDVGLARDMGRAIAYELKKLVVSLGAALVLFSLGLIPGVGALVLASGGITVAVMIVCLDFLDSPLERRRLRFRDKLKVLGSALPASASFGFVCWTLVSIPLINLLAIPLCVTAGTLFVCDRVLPLWDEKS